MPGFTVKVEESDVGQLYTTLEGTTDTAGLANLWKQVTEVWAKESVQLDSQNFWFLEGEQALSAEEVQEIIDRYGEPSSTLAVVLPGNNPLEIAGAWANKDHYMARRTTELRNVWTPGMKTAEHLRVISRLDPVTILPEAEAQANINRVIQRYTQEIEHGTGPSILSGFAGEINNMTVAHVWDNYLCSGYQEMVIRWLGEIRTAPDEAQRGLLTGLSYGPIQTNGGGHWAVVLYPTGSDWRTTGVVLDPWITQAPVAYPIGEWADALWFRDGANQPQPDSDEGHLYPHLSGQAPGYPAEEDFALDTIWRGAKPITIVVLRSPVAVMLILEDGRRVGGLPDGTVVNEAPGELDVYSQPVPGREGEVQWVFYLPDVAYRVELVGMGDGMFHAAVSTADGFQAYPAQEIRRGETEGFAVASGGEAGELSLPNGGLVPAQLVEAEAINRFMGVGAEAEGEPAMGDVPGSSDQPAESEGGHDRLREFVRAGVSPIVPVCCLAGLLAIGGGMLAMGLRPLLRSRRGT